MENKPTSSKTEIGWPDVLDMAGAMTMFFCCFVNKKVSHTPWLYIIGGTSFVLWIGEIWRGVKRLVRKKAV